MKKEYTINGSNYFIVRDMIAEDGKEFSIIQEVDYAIGWRESDDEITESELENNLVSVLDYSNVGNVLSTTFCYTEGWSESEKSRIESEWQSNECKYCDVADIYLNIRGPFRVDGEPLTVEETVVGG